jgi:hypothetical protein
MPRSTRSATVRGAMDGQERLCRLEQLEGRLVPCPEEKCAFWEPGGKIVEGRCVLHGIDFQHEPGLAAWLLEFRNSLAREAGE